MYSAEDELCELKTKLVELQVLNDKHKQKAAETEKLFRSAQWEWEEEQQRLSRERDNICRLYCAEMEFLIREKSETEKAYQETNAALKNLRRILRDTEIEPNGCSEMLRLQANYLDFKAKQQERLMTELEAATVKTKKLEENAEAARVAHLQCKYTTEIMQFTRTAYARERGDRGKEEIGDTSGRLVDARTSCSLQEGPLVRKKACGMRCLGFLKHTVKIFEVLRVCSAALRKNSAILLPYLL